MFDPESPDAPVTLIDAPAGPTEPDPKFWQKYSPRLEFPISLVLSVFLLTVLFSVLVGFMLLGIGDGPQKKVPQFSMIDGGKDDDGDGSKGSAGGGTDAPEKVAPVPVAEQPTDQPMPEVKLPDTQVKPEVTPEADAGPTTPAESQGLSALEEKLKTMLPGTPGQTGGGKGGADNGTGPGGTGADATLRRSLRWTINFRTADGRDYANQLNALGAVVLIPDPSDPVKKHLVSDLKNPRKTSVATDAEMAKFVGQVQFYDSKPESVRQIGELVGLPFRPTAFWAIFPKGLEAEMASLEAGYKGRRAADIEQTRFAVAVVGGRYQLTVADQTMKRGR